MLHLENETVRKLVLQGNFGLEKESLRVDQDGFLAHTKYPFPDNDHIVRDFCENQTEINTSVANSAAGAIALLEKQYREIQQTLAALDQQEYLWPFSNPPYIRNEEDIPIAQYTGDQAHKTVYREYLSDRYGRYRMTFSGIHCNYSFSEELLQADFALSSEKDYRVYKDQLYVELAEHLLNYGWIMVAITAASPVVDSSFVEKGVFDKDVFQGMASLRCSEQGYWNFFTPVFDYTDIIHYVESMQYYVKEGWIQYPSELYFPIRLKPMGENTLENLIERGVSHVELRMFDLNPLNPVGVDERDVVFAQLLIIWLASMPRMPLAEKDQVQAVQNFKNAAHYDLKTVKIVLPNEEVMSVARAARNILSRMKEFYQDFSDDVQAVLKFQEEKFLDQEKRYSWQVRREYGDGFVAKGMKLAQKRQKEMLE